MKFIHFLIYSSIGHVIGFLPVLDRAEAGEPSFDCAKAVTRAEKAICQDEQLGALDTALLATLKATLEKNPAIRDTLLSEERKWVRERDRACIPANATPSQSAAIVACLKEAYEKRIDVLRFESSAPATEVEGYANKAVCHKIVDRYKALVKADPEAPFRKGRWAEWPLNLLAESKTSGIAIEPETEVADFGKDPKMSILKQLPTTPALAFPKEVLDAFAAMNGDYARFSNIRSSNLFRVSSVQGSMGCYYDVFFYVKENRAQLVKEPDDWGGDGSCGASENLGTIDGEPFVFDSEETSVSAYRWDGENLTPACKVDFAFAPRFSFHATNHENDDKCIAANCDALHNAALHLAEFVNSNRKDTQKLLLEKLSPPQRKDFEILKQKSEATSGGPHDAVSVMTDEHPLLVPLLVENQVYLARIGQFTIGWRNFPDWKVVIEQGDKTKSVEIASFAIGMTNGVLTKATVQ